MVCFSWKLIKILMKRWKFHPKCKKCVHGIRFGCRPRNHATQEKSNHSAGTAIWWHKVGSLTSRLKTWHTLSPYPRTMYNKRNLVKPYECPKLGPKTYDTQEPVHSRFINLQCEKIMSKPYDTPYPSPSSHCTIIIPYLPDFSSISTSLVMF